MHLYITSLRPGVREEMERLLHCGHARFWGSAWHCRSSGKVCMLHRFFIFRPFSETIINMGTGLLKFRRVIYGAHCMGVYPTTHRSWHACFPACRNIFSHPRSSRMSSPVMTWSVSSAQVAIPDAFLPPVLSHEYCRPSNCSLGRGRRAA